MTVRAITFTLLTLSLCLGCGDKDDTAPPEGDTDTDTDTDTDSDADADADSDTDADADADADSDTDADPLPDLTEDLDQDVCEDGPGDEGATTYYLGTYLNNRGAPLVGTEQWIWYANSQWEAVGGADCVVTWNVVGTECSTDACTDCDIGIIATAEIDIDATTCPEAGYADLESWEERYAVRYNEDGSADWFFATTGNPLASGFWNEAGQNFVTAASCWWF